MHYASDSNPATKKKKKKKRHIGGNILSTAF